MSIIIKRLDNFENGGANFNPGENWIRRCLKPLNYRALDYRSVSFSSGLTLSICFHAVKENGYKIFSPIA